MQIRNPHYFNAYKFRSQPLLLLICYLLLACSGQNDTKQALPFENPPSTGSPVVNINTATAADLEKLPHIGVKTAREIVEHRERYGKFRQPEHLLLVDGISDKKFREIKELIKAE